MAVAESKLVDPYLPCCKPDWLHHVRPTQKCNCISPYKLGNSKKLTHGKRSGYATLQSQSQWIPFLFNRVSSLYIVLLKIVLRFWFHVTWLIVTIMFRNLCKFLKRIYDQYSISQLRHAVLSGSSQIIVVQFG